MHLTETSIKVVTSSGNFEIFLIRTMGSEAFLTALSVHVVRNEAT